MKNSGGSVHRHHEDTLLLLYCLSACTLTCSRAHHLTTYSKQPTSSKFFFKPKHRKITALNLPAPKQIKILTQHQATPLQPWHHPTNRSPAWKVVHPPLFKPPPLPPTPRAPLARPPLLMRFFRAPATLRRLALSLSFSASCEQTETKSSGEGEREQGKTVKTAVTVTSRKTLQKGPSSTVQYSKTC